MKVLLFDFGYYFTPHVETEADIVQQHLDRGDEVVRLACQGEMPVCVVNPAHNLGMCALCLCRRRAAWGLVHPRVPVKSVFHLTEKDREAIRAFTFRGARLSDLKRLTFGPFDVGLAVASVLVDETANPDPDLTANWQQVRDWIGVSLAAYLSALNILEQEKPDRVYVMNGRWGSMRAVLRACQLREVPCHVHERAGDLNRYLLSVNRLPHDLTGLEALIEEVWRSADPAEREAVGSTYFVEKAGGIERQWYSFVADQKKGQLPDSWDPSRRNVAVFLSSEFERAALGPDWDYRFYKDQNDGLGRVVASAEARGAPVHLNVRVHPYMKNTRNATLEWILALRSPKATIIPPDSPVSSYALLHACEKALTFGSTMSIEATYWGKPSVLAGPAGFQNLGGTYNPNTHEELIDLLLAELPPKPKEPALKYGYYELRKGFEHVYYQPQTPARGQFKGVEAFEGLPWYWRVVLKLARSHRLRWLDPVQRLSGLHRRWRRHRIGLPVVEKTAPPAG